MRIRKEERNIAHGPMDEPYFALKYLGSTSYAGKTCSCMHVFGQTAGNYQAWMHYTHAEEKSVHERACALPGGPMQGAIDRLFQVQRCLSF